MYVTLLLTGTCPDCNRDIEGVEVAQARVNLHSFRTRAGGLVGFRRCCGTNRPPEAVSARMDDESATKVRDRQKTLRERAEGRRRLTK